MSDLLTNFRAARSAGTTLMDIRTPDAAATIRVLLSGLNDDPVLHLDVDGFRALNRKGAAAAKALGSAELLECLRKLAGTLDRAIVFLENAQALRDQPATLQAIWRTRDRLKTTGSMLVLLTPPGSTLLRVLAQDVLVPDEPIPA